MEDKEKLIKEGYTEREILEAFQKAMSFWDKFWELAWVTSYMKIQHFKSWHGMIRANQTGGRRARHK